MHAQYSDDPGAEPRERMILGDGEVGRALCSHRRARRSTYKGRGGEEARLGLVRLGHTPPAAENEQRNEAEQENVEESDDVRLVPGTLSKMTLALIFSV